MGSLSARPQNGTSFVHQTRKGQNLRHKVEADDGFGPRTLIRRPSWVYDDLRDFLYIAAKTGCNCVPSNSL